MEVDNGFSSSECNELLLKLESPSSSSDSSSSSLELLRFAFWSDSFRAQMVDLIHGFHLKQVRLPSKTSQLRFLEIGHCDEVRQLDGQKA